MNLKNSNVGAGALSALLFLTMLVTFVPTFAQQSEQPYVLSERIGSDIDSTERIYFNLFPNLPGFIAARVVEQSDTSVRFIITRQTGGNRSDTMIDASRLDMPELGRYIDRFEKLFTEDFVGVKMRSILPYSRPLQPYDETAMTLSVETRSGEHLRGMLLGASDSLLLLLPEGSPLAWQSLDTIARLFSPSQLARVQDARGIFGRMSEEIDVRFEGNDTVYRKIVLPTIADQGLFIHAYSPEIMRLIERSYHGPTRHASPSVRELTNGVYRGKIVVEASVDSFIIPSRSYREELSYHRGFATQKVNIVPPQWSIGVDYSLSKRLQAGLRYSQSGKTKGSNYDSDTDFETVYGRQIEAIVSGLLIAPGTYRTSIFNRFELAGGVGIATRLLTIESRVLGEDSPHSAFRIAIGGSFLARAGYFLMKFVSINIEVKAVVYPDVEVDRRTYTFEGFGSQQFAGSHEAYALPLNALGVALGIRLHI